jgi:type I restriction enzyme R subunit
MKQHTEDSFEITIEKQLLSNGYERMVSQDFDKSRALFPKVVIEFIKKSQPKQWDKLRIIHGERTGEVVVQELSRMLDTSGSLSVLRHGFKCYGQRLYMAFFKPANGLNPDTLESYQLNRLGVCRQLQYSAKNTNELDLCISINGLPILTAELKNPMTGSRCYDAIKQYQKDRDPREKIFQYKLRTLVHFAVDPDLVFMTTKLAKDATHFLPFNKGNQGGAGNPSCENDYTTAYLWKEVWHKDSLLDIIGKFMHLQVEDKLTDEGQKYTKETLIFPRYHQLVLIHKLLKETIKEGPGNNYLIEHSAGSGKSNSIAWLAHRLSSIHNKEDKKIFNSIIVITDRIVLDRQLQDTIYQFEHKQGVVVKIDKDSKQLAEALESETPIIITTLQKFPFVTDHIIEIQNKYIQKSEGILPDRNYAVIIDEAHSSQSGDTATELKTILGGENLIQEIKERYQEYESSNSDSDNEILKKMASRGKLRNLSFYAFTATPKHSTLGVFGRDGKPFHKYSMRQAIEEGFIMDVLKNYTTYKAYYGLIKKAEKDLNVEKKKAAKALTKYLELHEHNIAQKTITIIEHFRTHTMHKIGGKAKAMVVTSGRLEAIRYKQSFDEYIKKKGYTDIKALVAFSGVVKDDINPSISYTEVEMNNGIKESELPFQFATVNYQILLVAEKYQTGFDQPLLHTMYINKRLDGIQTVQTLSRLNRMHPLKEDTFILDFINNRDDILEAFKQFYEGAEMGEDPEPGKLYQLYEEIRLSALIDEKDLINFSQVYFKPRTKQNPNDHKLITLSLKPTIDNFSQLLDDNEDQAELLRSKLKGFRSVYSYLSQIIPFTDSDLEILYAYLRHLLPCLPSHYSYNTYNFDDTVRLQYYRLQKEAEGDLNLISGEVKPLKGPCDVGTAKATDEDIELSKLINVLNERFGTEFTEADQLFFDQIQEAAVEDEELQDAAKANSLERFLLLFNTSIERLIIERMDQNMEIFAKFINDGDFRSIISPKLAEKVYESIRVLSL